MCAPLSNAACSGAEIKPLQPAKVLQQRPGTVIQLPQSRDEVRAFVSRWEMNGFVGEVNPPFILTLQPPSHFNLLACPGVVHINPDWQIMTTTQPQVG